MGSQKKDTTLGKNFVGKSRAMMQHPAYRDLRPVARALLDELIFRFNGGNNGEIHLALRIAAERVNSHRDTIATAYRELSGHGFIKPTRGDNWQARQAREWLLTFRAHNGKEPTNDYKNWKPDKEVFRIPVRYKRKD